MVGQGRRRRLPEALAQVGRAPGLGVGFCEAAFDTDFAADNGCRVGRTIIVGDVHGCAAELSKLLAAVRYEKSADALVFVGDLIARGPSSVEVLRLFRASGAQSVLGNHEARMLEARRSRVAGVRGPRLGPAHYRLLHQLSESDWQLIESFPLYLDLLEHGIRVVHAGVLPGVPFGAQDPWTLTHIRSVTEDGQASARSLPTPWAAHYRGEPHIVFGHNSRLLMQLHPHATGLDTGCVYGGELTALVLEAGQRIPEDPAARRALMVSVPAEARYYVGVEGPPSSR